LNDHAADRQKGDELGYRQEHDRPHNLEYQRAKGVRTLNALDEQISRGLRERRERQRQDERL